MKTLFIIMALLVSVDATSQEIETSNSAGTSSKYHASFDAGFFHGFFYRGLSIGQFDPASNSILSLSYSDSGTDIYDGITKNVGVGFRQFLGDSFNIKASSSYRILKARDYWYNRENFLKTSEYLFTYEDIIFDFSIGNHWTFDSGLYLGADWIGLGGQLGHISSSVKYETGGPEGRTKQRIRNMERARKLAQMTLLNFSMGYLF